MNTWPRVFPAEPVASTIPRKETPACDTTMNPPFRPVRWICPKTPLPQFKPRLVPGHRPALQGRCCAAPRSERRGAGNAGGRAHRRFGWPDDQPVAGEQIRGGRGHPLGGGCPPAVYDGEEDTAEAGRQRLVRWHSTPAPEADVAPGWNGGGGQTAGENSPAGGPTGPQGSTVVEAIPAGLGGNVHAPTWAEGAQGSLAAGVPPGGNNAAEPNLPTQIPPSGVSPGFPAGGDRAAQTVEANRPTALGKSGSGDQRPVYQADARNDPANAYRAENRNSPSPAVSPLVPDPNREVAPADPGLRRHPRRRRICHRLSPPRRPNSRRRHWTQRSSTRSFPSLPRRTSHERPGPSLH